MALIAWGRRPTPAVTAALPRWQRLRGGRRLVRVRRRSDVVRGVTASIATTALASLVAWQTVEALPRLDVSMPTARVVELAGDASAAVLMALLPPVPVDPSDTRLLVSASTSPGAEVAAPVVVSDDATPATSVLAPEARDLLATHAAPPTRPSDPPNMFTP